ncbi:hypothetical protein ACFL5G_05175 [Candidatus Margulisiibacteriota bacterium]
MMSLEFKGKVGLTTGQGAVFLPGASDKRTPEIDWDAVGVRGECELEHKFADSIFYATWLETKARYDLGILGKGSKKHKVDTSFNFAKINLGPFRGLSFGLGLGGRLNYHNYPDDEIPFALTRYVYGFELGMNYGLEHKKFFLDADVHTVLGYHNGVFSSPVRESIKGDAKYADLSCSLGFGWKITKKISLETKLDYQFNPVKYKNVDDELFCWNELNVSVGMNYRFSLKRS